MSSPRSPIAGRNVDGYIDAPYFRSIFAQDVSTETAADLDVRLAFVALADIGAAAARAFENPARFHGVELELAGDFLNFREAARILAQVTGTEIELPVSPEAAIEEGLMPVFALSQRFTSAHPAPARPASAHELGLPTTSFTTWARETLGR
ncbi:NmrA family NAD(P)-binding protein [Nocardia sp. NPDC058658]|uniref:NmrA family NAD(P)-binding protein n=1 Tax=Nocardia sp. NPDC058658 TaxID=3346580 RepID=UPI0036569419